MAAICNICNKRRNYTGTGLGVDPAPHASEMCNLCYTEGGYENQHSDAGHTAIAQEVAAGNELSEYGKSELKFMESCWICHPELNLAQKPAKKASTGPKAQGTRRQQLNHRGHSHPQTPAARRECKKLFWASLTPVANVNSNDQLAAAMHAWDARLDAFGKSLPAPAKKAGWAGVHPKGKTRSVQSTGK